MSDIPYESVSSSNGSQNDRRDSLKFFYNGKCKKIVLGHERLTWDGVTKLLANAFRIQELDKLHLIYMDESSTEHKVQTEEELQEAYKNLFFSKFIRFFVHYSGQLELSSISPNPNEQKIRNGSDSSNSCGTNHSQNGLQSEEAKSNAKNDNQDVKTQGDPYENFTLNEITDLCSKAKENTALFRQVENAIKEFVSHERDSEKGAEKIEYQIEGNLAPLAHDFARNLNAQLLERQRSFEAANKANSGISNSKLFPKSEEVVNDVMRRLEDPMFYSRVVNAQAGGSSSSSILPPVYGKSLFDDLDDLSAFMRQLDPKRELIDVNALRKLTVVVGNHHNCKCPENGQITLQRAPSYRSNDGNGTNYKEKVVTREVKLDYARQGAEGGNSRDVVATPQQHRLREDVEGDHLDGFTQLCLVLTKKISSNKSDQ